MLHAAKYSVLDRENNKAWAIHGSAICAYSASLGRYVPTTRVAYLIIEETRKLQQLHKVTT